MIFAVIVGVIVAEVCGGILELILGVHTISITYGATDFLIGIMALFIGGFVSTFLVKEKKIRYGIFVGIIVILIGILKLYIEMVNGLMIPGSFYYVRIGEFVSYLLFAGIGGYFGIIISKRLKEK